MMKFFRKYNKQMLAVFMALLLVVWLGGAALSSLFTPDPSGQIVAQTKLGPIRFRDKQQAEHDTHLLANLGLPWSTLGVLRTPLEYDDWILLQRETRDLGLKVERAQVEEFLKLLGLDANRVHEIAFRQNLKDDVIYETVADFVRVRRLAFDYIVEAGTVSEAELQAAAREYLETVQIKAVVLKASAFADEQETFSDEQIREQFERGREQKRGEGLTFGYFLPPRVKAQYVRVDLEKVKGEVHISPSTLARRAREYWDSHKKDPAFERPRDPAQTQPATQPTYVDTFEEAQAAATEAVVKQAAKAEAEQLAENLIKLTSELWFDAPKGPDEYKVAPDAVKKDDYYAAMIAALPASVRHAAALEASATDWFTSETAGQIPGIGKATAVKPGETEARQAGPPFATLAFEVQGLAEMPKDSRADISGYHALYQSTALPLRDAEGNLYVFRIVAVEAAHAPKSVDEARDQVIADLKLKAAYDRAATAGQTLAAAAKAAGLKAAWEAPADFLRDKAPQGVLEPRPFAHKNALGLSLPEGFMIGNNVQGVGSVDDDFVDACFGLKEKLEGQWQIASIPQPQLSEVVVVEWVETKPMSKQQYQQYRKTLLERLQTEHATRAISAWLAPAQIRERLGYRLTRGA